MKLVIPSSKIDSMFKVDLSKFYLIEKRQLSDFFLCTGILLLYFGSLHPWFLWPLKELYPIPAACLLLTSYIIANSMKESAFNRQDSQAAIFCYALLSFYIIISGSQNINAYITNCFSIMAVYVLLKSDTSLLNRMLNIVAKVFALMLIPSIAGFVMYLIGFGLPHSNAVFGDNLYSFSNYYFFMVDDRFLMTLIPRFQSVFLEPGHLGSATAVLLMTQLGHWKKWWNVILIVASIISFSLASYALLIALSFLSLWVQRKGLIKKMIAVAFAIGAIAACATLYNGGDNLVNNLILARLEVDDRTGEMAGNNRVDEGFEKEYDKFITTTDAFFGRDMSKIPKGSGNSGYRVFIYQNGLVGLLLVILFYGISFRSYGDIRYLQTCVCISVLIFWIRGYPLWYSNFIPIFATAYQKYVNSGIATVAKNEKTIKNALG